MNTRSIVMSLSLLGCGVPLGCSASNGSSGPENEAGTGNTPGGGSSGATSTNGGTTSQGGTSNGGTTSQGGATSGGVNALGGATNGGTTSQGGATNGGANTLGGATSNGGMTSQGGMTSGGSSSNGGSSSSGGASSGGSSSKGGSTSTGGSSSGGTSTGGAASTCKAWPAAAGAQSVSSTIKVSGTYDGGLKRFTGSGDLGGSGQEEGQDPIFEVANGGTLKNVIIGAPAADGIHCTGTCTLQNVWWEDVGEDAATLKGSNTSQVMTVDCGGAKSATDKVFQHNGPGTMIIKNFTVQTFGKLYRSCGNCSSQYQRKSQFWNITATGGSSELVGINQNYKDSAEFHNITVPSGLTICKKYTGNNTGAEPTSVGSGADGTYCIYDASEIHTQ